MTRLLVLLAVAVGGYLLGYAVADREWQRVEDDPEDEMAQVQPLDDWCPPLMTVSTVAKCFICRSPNHGPDECPNGTYSLTH